MSVTEKKIGFIGAGRMATALARGLVAAQLASPDRLLASDPSKEAREHFARASGGATTTDNAEVAAQSGVVFLAVKPQDVSATLADLQGNLTDEHLLISIAAGVRLDTIAKAVGDGARLVRVMPNTPCLVGKGASAYCLGPRARGADGKRVADLLSAVGIAFEVDEKLLDAVTGLSGSGPAFVYVMIEALSDGGVRMGLPRDVATALASHTVRGAAEMVVVGNEHPAVLKDRVTSPGGTTIAGLQALESGGFRAALISAVDAATRRSVELGKQL
jgi:pyrroline-5-carboxylate reductase